MHWLEVACIICVTFLCGNALEYKDTDACTNDAAYIQHCGYWAKNGYCFSDQEFMHAKCKKSCGVCKKNTATKQSTTTTTKLDSTLKSDITAEQNTAVDPDIAAVPDAIENPDNTVQSETTARPEHTAKPTTTAATDGDAFDKNCTYRPGTRGTYSGLENKPCDSKEECCEMCRARSECEAVTFNVGRCWMHTSEYKNNIKEDCQTCYFAEMCGTAGKKKTTENSTATTVEQDNTANPTTTATTSNGGDFYRSCTYRSGARGTYSGLENKPSVSKEECCEMCQDRSGCRALTFESGHCWMHTIEYKDNIQEDCSSCFFAEI